MNYGHAELRIYGHYLHFDSVSFGEHTCLTIRIDVIAFQVTTVQQLANMCSIV